MTRPLWCLMIVALIPWVLALLASYLRGRQLGRVDNHHPRIQVTEVTGVAARAYAAQMNAWEALGFFTAAVVTAHLAGADPVLSARAAILFLVARLFHAAFYLGNLAGLRSLATVVGLGSGIWLFTLAARAP